MVLLLLGRGICFSGYNSSTKVVSGFVVPQYYYYVERSSSLSFFLAAAGTTTTTRTSLPPLRLQQQYQFNNNQRLLYHKKTNTVGLSSSSSSSKTSLTATTIENDDNNNNSSVLLEPLIVCGPSGVGKGTIITKFMEEMGGNTTFGFTVSHTTRSPREGEIDGIHYHFVKNIDDFKSAISDGEFIEYAMVHGNYYGTSLSSLRKVQQSDESDGKRCLLDIDVQGVQNIKTQESSLLKPKYIFIAPPSIESLKERLINRGSESKETLERRTANAQKELDYGLQDGNFDAIIINNDLDIACKEFAEKIHELFDDDDDDGKGR